MEILGVIILGGIAGWIATLLVGNEREHGLIGNIVIGIVGAFLAGIISRALTGSDQAELGTFTWHAFFWAIGGAVVLLLAWNAVHNRNQIR